MPQEQESKQGGITFSGIFVNAIICGGAFSGYFAWRRYLRRLPNALSVSPYRFKRQTMLGKVVSVGDADNFRFFHTPGGYLAGWGWLRPVPKTNARGIAETTIMVRLNGIDAPEAAHFGKPAQRYSKEALEWLREYILGRRVRIVPLSRDQYGRIVAEARIWKWNGRKNVSKEMLRAGWATVYEGKINTEFNGMEKKFHALEARSRKAKKGMFKNGKIETPAEYKRKYRQN